MMCPECNGVMREYMAYSQCSLNCDLVLWLGHWKGGIFEKDHFNGKITNYTNVHKDDMERFLKLRAFQ